MRSLQFPHGLPEALEDDVLPLNRHRLSKPWLLAPYFPLSELSVASVIMMADSANSTPLESYPAIVVRAALDVRGLSGSLSRLCFAVGVGLLTCISVVSAPRTYFSYWIGRLHVVSDKRVSFRIMLIMAKAKVARLRISDADLAHTPTTTARTSD